MTFTRIFGQRVDCITKLQVFNIIQKAVKDKKKILCFAANIHSIVTVHNTGYSDEYEKAKLIFADGVPLIWLSAFTKKRLPERVSGTDLVEKILQNEKYRVAVIGSTPQVLKALVKRYSQTIVVSYSPPFKSKWDDKKIITLVNKSKAEILLLGVGPLKQEKWLLDNFRHTQAYVGIGVGSAFDILSGKTPRAPKWMRDNGFEWLWRIFLEPRRLFIRYLSDMVILVRIAIRSLLH